MRNEQFKAFLWYFISHQMSFRVKLSLSNFNSLKNKKVTQNTVKMSIFQKIHIQIVIIYSKQS